MDIGLQRFGLWCAPLALVLFGVGLVPLAHFIPPPSPAASAQEIAALYAAHSVGIRIGCILFLLSGTLLVPITAIYSVLIREMEGSRFLAYAQLITGTVALVLFLPPVLLWTTAAFRPDTAPELIRFVNDMGWFAFLMTTPPGILQVLLLGVAILRDRHPQPLFPRWVAYANFWAAMLLLPSSAISLFTHGVLAWNGILAFWIPINCFGLWWIMMIVMVFKALRRLEARQRA